MSGPKVKLPYSFAFFYAPFKAGLPSSEQSSKSEMRVSERVTINLNYIQEEGNGVE